jgi:hypothetical protein
MNSSTSTSDSSPEPVSQVDEQRRYRRFLVLLLGVYGATIPLNALVDPFDVFGTENPCFQRHQDEAQFNRMTIVHRAERSEPQLAVLGTSRAAVYDAQAMETLTGLPTHVLSVPAANIYELRRHYDYLQARKPVRKLLLGIDYYAFNPHRRPISGFDERRLSGDDLPWSDYALAATHHQSLRASLDTLRRCLAESVAPRGPVEARVEAAHMDDAPEISLRPAIYFAENVDFYGSEMLDDLEAVDREIDHLRAILSAADEAGIEIHLYISPIYYKHWLMIHAMGRAESYAHWLRQVTQLRPLWYFAGISSVTLDQQMFDDTSHFNREVSLMIARRVLGLQTEGLPDDFGLWLTPENVDATLAAENRAIDSELVSELRSLVE